MVAVFLGNGEQKKPEYRTQITDHRSEKLIAKSKGEKTQQKIEIRSLFYTKNQRVLRFAFWPVCVML